MNLPLGLVLVLVAGLFQGSFVLPMTLTRGWKWEHTWAMFSLLGMLIFNWSIGLYSIPHLLDAIRQTPSSDLVALLAFGTCWGAGAVLFGLGMEKLGMAVGYPVIMGLILSLGSLIPLAQSRPSQFVSRPGLLLLVGVLIVLAGILMCSRAAAGKQVGGPDMASSTTAAGLTIAVFAGILSCLPNVGLSNAAALTTSALRFGASAQMAGNAAWVVQFTAGFAVNFIYCLFLIMSRGNASAFGHEWVRNAGLVAAMAWMWISSFYLYGMGAARMGRWGAIIGWPLFISVSILVGNLCGLWRGEWRSATSVSRAQLNRGLTVVLLAVVLFGLASAVH